MKPLLPLPPAIILALAAPALLVAGAEEPLVWIAPAEAKARTSPVAPSDDVLKKGRALYERNCATCHGDKGRGDGPYSKRSYAKSGLRPQDLTDPTAQARLTDGEIFWKVGEGLRRDGQIIMPAFEKELGSEENRWKVVLFVRALGNLGAR